MAPPASDGDIFTPRGALAHRGAFHCMRFPAWQDHFSLHAIPSQAGRFSLRAVRRQTNPEGLLPPVSRHCELQQVFLRSFH